MAQERWSQVDDYLAGVLIPSDAALDAAVRAGVDAGMPQIQVSPTQGKFLYLMARMLGARKILEIGTLAGYSTIWMARALPPDGRLITLEVDPDHAEVARSNFRRARLDSMIEVRVGSALESASRPGCRRRGTVRPRLHRRGQGEHPGVRRLGAANVTPGDGHARRQRRAPGCRDRHDQQRRERSGRSPDVRTRRLGAATRGNCPSNRRGEGPRRLRHDPGHGLALRSFRLAAPRGARLTALAVAVSRPRLISDRGRHPRRTTCTRPDHMLGFHM